MRLFLHLSPEEEARFRRWAQDNYKPFTPIPGDWHPVIIEECARINAFTSDLSSELSAFDGSISAE